MPQKDPECRGNVHRKQNDWKAVEELDKVLRKLDPLDPIKYDFALFGLGIDKISDTSKLLS